MFFPHKLKTTNYETERITDNTKIIGLILFKS
jgi:hypothetical protein